MCYVWGVCVWVCPGCCMRGGVGGLGGPNAPHSFLQFPTGAAQLQQCSRPEPRGYTALACPGLAWQASSLQPLQPAGPPGLHPSPTAPSHPLNSTFACPPNPPQQFMFQRQQEAEGYMSQPVYPHALAHSASGISNASSGGAGKPFGDRTTARAPFLEKRKLKQALRLG